VCIDTYADAAMELLGAATCTLRAAEDFPHLQCIDTYADAAMEGLGATTCTLRAAELVRMSHCVRNYRNIKKFKNQERIPVPLWLECNNISTVHTYSLLA
jgi:hypothetical protein